MRPITVETINEMEGEGERKEGVRRRKIKRQKKEYHNKELEEIYLQRIAPVRNTRSASTTKHNFRASKYNL